MNIVQCFFLNSALVVVVFGFLLNLLEPYLPAFTMQIFCYGKMNNTSERNRFLSKLEVPKSWFRHFYIFATAWSLLALSVAVNCVRNETSAPDFMMDLLDFFAGGKKRKMLVSSTSGLLALTLITMQVVRRLYETHFVQIFSSRSKMNLWHYLLAIAHYFGIVVAVLANTEGFVRGTIAQPFSLSAITRTQYICCLIFYFSWSQQRNANRMLANLRRDKAGNKVTEEHMKPHDGFFEYVSSPHMLFEVIMYVSICGVIPTCNTWHYVAIWVMINQTESAWLTHMWYKENIKDYPEERYAIYPKIL